MFLVLSLEADLGLVKCNKRTSRARECRPGNPDGVGRRVKGKTIRVVSKKENPHIRATYMRRTGVWRSEV